MTLGETPKKVMSRIDEIGESMVAEWLKSAKPDERAVYEAYRKSLD